MLVGANSRWCSSEDSHVMLCCADAGHSLGGALAQLAAHDIARAAEGCGKTVRVGCYTYGSPRVGNHAFARELDQVSGPN